MSFDNFTPHPKAGKRVKKSKAASQQEKDYLKLIKSLHCIVADSSCSGAIEAHHIVKGKRLGHYFTLPLCHEHHEGRFSIGNTKKSFIAKYGSEYELLERVKAITRVEVPEIDSLAEITSKIVNKCI